MVTGRMRVQGLGSTHRDHSTINGPVLPWRATLSIRTRVRGLGPMDPMELDRVLELELELVILVVEVGSN